MILVFDSIAQQIDIKEIKSITKGKENIIIEFAKDYYLEELRAANDYYDNNENFPKLLYAIAENKPIYFFTKKES